MLRAILLMDWFASSAWFIYIGWFRADFMSRSLNFRCYRSSWRWMSLNARMAASMQCMIVCSSWFTPRTSLASKAQANLADCLSEIIEQSTCWMSVNKMMSLTRTWWSRNGASEAGGVLSGCHWNWERRLRSKQEQLWSKPRRPHCLRILIGAWFFFPIQHIL